MLCVYPESKSQRVCLILSLFIMAVRPVHMSVDAGLLHLYAGASAILALKSSIGCAQAGYFLPSSSGFSTIPEVPGQPLHMSGGVGSRGLRHSASAMELPRSGGMPGPLHEGFHMFGPGAAMAPLSNLPHFGSPRAQQVSLH